MHIKHIILTLFYLFLAALAGAQGNLQEQILEKVNHLRDSLNLSQLKLDGTLYEASKDQAHYMSVYNKLTHFQKTFSKETPSERVAFYKGNRTYVGENIAALSGEDHNEIALGAGQIADSLFLGWLNSPKHYENMIYPHYTKMGVGYALSKAKKIYAAQVFSSNEIELPESFQNSEVAWGVRPGEFGCKDEAQTYETMLFANSIIVEGNSIYFYFHDKRFFQNVIKNENDGLAVDIILRDQLPCGKENQFHISAVHDGEMQRPIYKNDIYRNNEAYNPRKVKIKLGEVPSYLHDEIWEPNIIVINDNKLCDYSYPVEAPSAIYPLLSIKPYYEIDDSVDVEFAGDQQIVSLKDSIHIELRYNRSEKKFGSVSFIPFYQMMSWGPYIKALNVECHASVEGASWFNQELLEDREKAVSDLLNENSFNMNWVQIKSSENWELMNSQIDENGLSQLKSKSQTDIKRYLKKNRTAFFDSLLFEQRKTHIRAYIDTTLKINSYADIFLSSNYDSTLTVGSLPWNKILREDYVLPHKPIEVGLIDSLKHINGLKTNLLAAASIQNTVNAMDSLLVQSFIKDLDTSNAKQVFNYAHFLTKYWFAKYSNNHQTMGVAESISPEMLRGMIDVLDTTDIRPNDIIRLKVNLLLAGIHYYVAHNTWHSVDSYFLAIAKLVKQGDFTQEEAIELALFCNYFYKFTIAVDILDPFHEKDLLLEDGLFVLAKTATLIKNSLEKDDYRAYLRSAKKSNQTRYCNWLNRSFQVQRDEFIKNDFCETCL